MNPIVTTLVSAACLYTLLCAVLAFQAKHRPRRYRVTVALFCLIGAVFHGITITNLAMQNPCVMQPSGPQPTATRTWHT